MRNYRIEYYAEVNDESVEREIEIVAENPWEALDIFALKVRLFKRVFKLEEIPNPNNRNPEHLQNNG